MVNGLSPPYMTNLLPGRVGDRGRYALRTSQNYVVPYCRTITYSKSFLPTAVTEWNRLDLEIKNAQSLSLFKIKCGTRVTRNSLFYYGPRWENVHLARMRIGCSNLKSHLFFNLHVEDNPSCQCGHPDENCEHFFFECPLFTGPRQRLFEVLDQDTVSVHNIMHGDPNESLEDNKLILDATYRYMHDTGRFNRQ